MVNLPTKSAYLNLFVVGLLLFLFAPNNVKAQRAIDWDVLADVTWKEEMHPELYTLWLVPTFGTTLKSYQNKLVTIEGYYIPFDAENNFYILSKFPMAACFFCGGAGPESVLELISVSGLKGAKLDEKVKVQGVLKLNKDDFDHCNYILENVKLVSKK